MPRDEERFRVYRLVKVGDEGERQEMIVGHPERGFVCATETSQNRARQWAKVYSETDRTHYYEVREVVVKTIQEVEDEIAVIRFKRGKGSL